MVKISGWKSKTLGTLIDEGKIVIQTGPFGTVLSAKEFVKYGIPVVAVREIREGYIQIFDETPCVSMETYNRLSKYNLATNDLVFARKGNVERSALIPLTKTKYFLGSDGICLRVITKNLLPQYLFYAIQSNTVRSFLIQNAYGTTMAGLNEKILSAIPLFLPVDIDEQSAIAETFSDNMSIAVTKKNIKNMYIRVLPPDGKVQITVPYSAGDDAIRMFAVSRISWIKKQRANFEAQARQTKRQYVTGETYYVWGRRYRLDVQYSNVRNEVSLTGGRLNLQVRPESTPEQREHVLNDWYREQLKSKLPEVIQKCEQVVGVHAYEWKVKNMRTKWGTCNIDRKRIWINLQLAKKTPECLAYVVTHELVHLLERNHNEQFQKYMDTFFPEWRVVKETMNQQMLDYMSE